MVRHTGENFIDVERVAEASMLSLQAAGINGPELDTPEADRLPADRDSAFCQKVFDISVAQVESVIEPDGIGNDIGRESVSFIGIHGPILAIPAVNLAVPL